jgi:hypothetical protein
MPKKRCTKNGKSGTKWGDEGTCYTGKNKDAKVEAQRKAIEASKHRKKGK